MARKRIERSFKASLKAYESWLAGQLDELWADDLREKHEKMKQNAFVFLRATYWRWAETILALCPDLDHPKRKTPHVIGVGDIHLENYGVWRDNEGRLVWGVNDFDEAAVMPYTVDLVRLATSAVLARPVDAMGRNIICTTILRGYRNGLKSPKAFVLDEEHGWLRWLVAVSEDERARFWRKMDKLKNTKRNKVPRHYRKLLEGALPRGTAYDKFAPRAAGTGSLGRPRWVGIADWSGGRLVREAKALVPSGWTLVEGRPTLKNAGRLAATGRYRAPDPWYEVSRGVVVRRLSPNARKIEVDDYSNELLGPDMLFAMGHELANIHLGHGKLKPLKQAISDDLDRRAHDWLHRATATAADQVTSEFKGWRG